MGRLQHLPVCSCGIVLDSKRGMLHASTRLVGPLRLLLDHWATASMCAGAQGGAVCRGAACRSVGACAAE